MSGRIKTRLEKIENQVIDDPRGQIIEWDRSRLTEEEAAFICKAGKVDEQVFMVTEDSNEHRLARSILDKHKDLLEGGVPRLIVLVPVTAEDIAAQQDWQL